MKKQNESKLSLLFGKTRASRAVALSGISLILVLALLIAANLLFGLLPMNLTKPDATGTDTFQISGTTLDYLKALDEDVTLYLICNGGSKAADADLLLFLARYAEASNHVKLEVIDSASDSEFIAAHGGTWPLDMSIVAESAKRYKIIEQLDLYYYVYSDSTYGEMKLTPLEYASTLESIEQSDTTGQASAMFMASTMPYFNGESCVTNAINYVTLDRVPTVYALTGNGTTALDAGLTSYVSDAGFDLSDLSSLTSIPANCDALLVSLPTVDLTEEEAAALSAYLAGGGKLFLTTLYNATEMPNLASVLKLYGLGFAEKQNLVCEGNTNYLYSASSPFLFNAHVNSEHPITLDYNGTVLTSSAHAIESFDVEGVEHTKLLYTSTLGYMCDPSNTQTQIGEKGELVFGISAQKGNTGIVWLAESNLLNAQINAYSSNGNFDLVLSSLNHLSGVTSDSIAISGRVIETPALSVTSAQFIVLGVIFVLILPITVAAIGIGIWYVRKKR